MKVEVNLLPPASKQTIRRLERYRLIAAEGWKGLFLISLVSLVYGGMFVVLSYQLRSAEAGQEKERQSLVNQEISRHESAIREANQAVGLARTLEGAHLNWSRLLEEIERMMPPAANLHRLTTQDYRVSLFGRAQTRDDLLLFQDQLKQSPCMEKVDAPLSNLFTQDNATFQIDLTVRAVCLKNQ